MFLCAIKGHGQFLKKSWLSYITELHTPNGCVSIDLTERQKAESRAKSKKRSKKQNKDVKWRFMKKLDDQDIIHEYCNSHITGVAAALYASSVHILISQCFNK